MKIIQIIFPMSITTTYKKFSFHKYIVGIFKVFGEKMKLGSVLKAGIAVVIIVAVIGLLFGTEIGRKFLGILELGAGKIISGLASLLKFPKKAENYLPMVLSADKESFFGQTFKVTNSISSSKGVCTKVKINDAIVDVSTCEISFESGNGTISYLNGSLEGTLSAFKTIINGLAFKQLKLDLSLIPSEFSFSGISETEISVSVKDGQLELFNPDGTSKCVISFKNKGVKISDFIGSLQLRESLIYLQGTAYFDENICLVK